MIETKEEKIKRLNEKIQQCEKCPSLVYSRKLYAYGKPTTGCGDIDSKILFVGMIPGMFGCGVTGIPFTLDRSGKLFTHFLNKVGLVHNQTTLNQPKPNVRVTNLVKCCPEDNRTPTQTEINNCEHFLKDEITVQNPRIIVPLGNQAMRFFYPGTNGISAREGVVDERRDLFGKKYIVPQFHPAYICRRIDLEPLYEKRFREIKELLDSL